AVRVRLSPPPAAAAHPPKKSILPNASFDRGQPCEGQPGATDGANIDCRGRRCSRRACQSACIARQNLKLQDPRGLAGRAACLSAEGDPRLPRRLVRPRPGRLPASATVSPLCRRLWGPPPHRPALPGTTWIWPVALPPNRVKGVLRFLALPFARLMPQTRFPDTAKPETQRRPQAATVHGITRVDEYAWLRAANWQEVFKDPATLDPAIRSHLEAENLYQAALLADAAGLRKALFAEMKGRIREDDSSVPMRDGPWAYGSSFKLGGEQPRYFRVPAAGGAEEIILDGDREAEGQAYFRLGGVDHSSDHKRLLWAFD